MANCLLILLQVYHLGICEHCQQRQVEDSLTPEQLFFQHVKNVAQHVKDNYPSVTPIVWDDMFRLTDLAVLKGIKLLCLFFRCGYHCAWCTVEDKTIKTRFLLNLLFSFCVTSPMMDQLFLFFKKRGNHLATLAQKSCLPSHFHLHFVGIVGVAEIKGNFVWACICQT